MNRLKYEIIKKKYPESRIWQRSWMEQKTRDKLAKAINDKDWDKEKQVRIQYISQKIGWKTTTSLNQEDLEFILSLSGNELNLLPWGASEENKYFYCAELFYGKKLDEKVWKSLKEKAAEYVYWKMVDDIKEDIVFKSISLRTVLKYISQHDLADIMCYNTNHWTYPYWQLDTLADYFRFLPELDPLEYAKKFEAQVGIRGHIPYGCDPIVCLIKCCVTITPEFEKYLIEKWYEKELKERKENDKEGDYTAPEVDYQCTEKCQDDGSWLQGQIGKDKLEIEGKIDELNKMFKCFRELADKRY